MEISQYFNFSYITDEERNRYTKKNKSNNPFLIANVGPKTKIKKKTKKLPIEKSQSARIKLHFKFRILFLKTFANYRTAYVPQHQLVFKTLSSDFNTFYLHERNYNRMDNLYIKYFNI